MPAAQPPEAAKAMQPPPHGSHVPLEKNNCIACHGEPDIWDASQRQFYISRDALNKDVHFQKGVNCHDCHGGNYQADDKNQAHAAEDGFRAKPAEVMKSCAACHKQETLELVKGVHAKAGAKNERGLGTPMQCQQCHGKIAHELLSVRDPKSPVFLEHQVKTCGHCHAENLATYNASVHGQAIIKQGLVVGPVCADCHGAHGIYRAADQRSTLNTLHVAQTCGKCHRFIEERLQASVHGIKPPEKRACMAAPSRKKRSSGPAPGGKTTEKPTCTSCHQGHDLPSPESDVFRGRVSNRCGNCHTKLSSQYALSIHGELTELGYSAAAKCSDCHGAHQILPPSDPHSRLSKVNRQKTCGKCHPGARANFVQFDPHADYADARAQPDRAYRLRGAAHAAVFHVRALRPARGLVVHSWAHRGAAARPGPGARSQMAGLRAFPAGPPHWPYRDARRVSRAGIDGAAVEVQSFGVGQGRGADLGRVFLDGLLASRLRSDRLRVFRGVLDSPGAAIFHRSPPGRADDPIAFWPRFPAPHVPRYSRLLRHDRLVCRPGAQAGLRALGLLGKTRFLGAGADIIIIGFTGLVLWFPNFFARFLPGTALNVAQVIHSTQALLATGFVFAIHFFNTHLRPDKFPADMSVMTGLVSEQEFKEERPDFMERLRRQGDLDALRTTSPSRRTLWFIRLGGMLALVLGLALLAGMVAAGLGG